MDVRIRPLADRDIDGHVAFLAEEARAAVARRFIDALPRTLDSLADRPALGSPRHLRDPRLGGMRARPVAGFRKVLVIDLTLDDSVEVVRVLHGARDIPPLLEQA